MRLRTLSALVSTTGLLILAACTPAAGPSASAAAPTVTVTVTVSPSPTAAPPAPDFGFTFFEEATIGSTWSQMSDQLHMPVAGGDICPWYGAIWNTELATTYAFTNAANPDSGVTFFYTNRFLAPDGASFPRNAEGVGVGSTQAQVLAAYPSAVVDSYEDLGAGPMTRITVNDPAGTGSKYVFGITMGSAVVDILQWGPNAGGQWSHLCTGL